MITHLTNDAKQGPGEMVQEPFLGLSEVGVKCRVTGAGDSRCEIQEGRSKFATRGGGRAGAPMHRRVTLGVMSGDVRMGLCYHRAGGNFMANTPTARKQA